MKLLTAAVWAGVLLINVSTVGALDIIECEQTIPVGEVGVLQGSLVCDGFGVRVEHRATLDLNGHTLAVSEDGLAPVVCGGKTCAVRGGDGAPGELAGFGGDTEQVGILAQFRRRLSVENVRFRDFTVAGIHAVGATVSATDVQIENCGQFGITGLSMKLNNVVTTGSLYGLYAAKKVRGIGVTAVDNGEIGVVGSRVSIRDGVLTGNATADVASSKPPRLRDTICERSAMNPQMATNWGTCSLD